VLECVAGAVHAGTFAVPKPENAFDPALGLRFYLLRTKHRCGRKVFIHRRHEGNVQLLQQVLCAPELLIDAAERRTAVA
jgi:hypothetical protein